MHAVIRWSKWWLTGCLLGGAALPLSAQTVTFENPLYKQDQTISGLDGWTKVGNGFGDQFIEKSESGNRFVRYNATESGMIFKDFSKQTGLVDMRWRWRSSGANTHFCVGVGSAIAASNAQNSDRVLACVDGLKVSATGQAQSAAADILADTWYYMRLRVDLAGTQYWLYMAGDSLRADERQAAGPAQIHMVQLPTNNNAQRALLKSDKNGGTADIDDFIWEPVSIWAGHVASDWYAALSWNGPIPDTNTHVVFDGSALGDCRITQLAGARSLTIQKEYTGAISLDTNRLAVLDNADFTGGGDYTFNGNGHINLASPRGQSLTPHLGKSLPPILHDKGGTVRQQGDLYGSSLWHASGTWDFNSHDLILDGSFLVSKGGPATFAHLAGRNIVVTKSAQLDGSAGSPLNLSTINDKPWHISVHDSLKVHWAQVGNSIAGEATGMAFQSSNEGNDSNWTFYDPPSVTISPRIDTVLIGQDAHFTATVKSKIPFTLQWLVNDNAVPQATDTAFTVKKVKRSYADSVLTCRAVNAAGPVFSPASYIVVSFPAPAVNKLPQSFVDSLRIKVSTNVPGAALAVSLNGGPWQTTDGNLLLKDSTQVQARGVLGGDSGDVATWIYPLNRLKQAEMPKISPTQTGFLDSVSVTILPVTPGSRIFYTLDRSDPDTLSQPYKAPFTLHATTLVRARALASGYRPSDISSSFFIRNSDTLGRPPKPTAVPPGGPVGDSLLVHLYDAENVTIYYSIEDPKKAPNLIKYDTSGIPLKEGATIRSFAVRGTNESGVSDTSVWVFTSLLEAPVASPKSSDFPDSLQIQLTSKSRETIRYTLDGSIPDSLNSRLYDGPFVIDSSAILKAAVFRGNQPASAVQTEIYRLVPAPPIATPKGGDYATATTITLQASSPKARIYYTLDGSTPGLDSRLYDQPFQLDTNATLKAVAVSGQGAEAIKGLPLVETYIFFLPSRHVLNPGDKYDLTSKYSIANSPAGSKIEVEVLTADSLKTHGFRDIQFGIRVGLTDGAPSFPAVYFNEPAGEERSLYEVTAAGTVYLSSADNVKLPEPGVYFLGIDTEPPVIAVSQEKFVEDDSTLEVLTVHDNVANLLMDLERSDAPDLNQSEKKIGNQEFVQLRMKAKSGSSLVPLTLKLRVDDHHNLATFPDDPASAYQVAQRIPAVRSPGNLRIGFSPDYPWDLVSVPMDLEKPLTLDKLRGDNSASGLIGMVWNPRDTIYHPLRGDEPIPGGASVWLGMETSLTSLAFSDVQTKTHYGNQSYKVTLHPGWNMVGNPGLATLYWPYTKRVSEVIDASNVKGLHAPNGGDGWFDTDSLEPWKGYFVFLKGTSDASVELRTTPVDAPSVSLASAKAGAAPAGLSLRLSLGSFQQLRLGASPAAVDGMGIEDEPQPPVRADRSPRLAALRGRALLGTDVMHWAPGVLYRWKVVAGLPAAPPRDRNGEVTPASARVEGLVLPEGYAAWAVSAKRGLKFPLTPGASLPLAPGFTDSLEILAGPAAELEARLASIPARVRDFRLVVAPAREGGAVLHLRLPRAVEMRWSLWTTTGRSAGEGLLRLPEGIYELPLRMAASGRGLYVFHAEWSGDGPAGALSQKVVLP